MNFGSFQIFGLGMVNQYLLFKMSVQIFFLPLIVERYLLQFLIMPLFGFGIKLVLTSTEEQGNVPLHLLFLKVCGILVLILSGLLKLGSKRAIFVA